MIKIKEPSKELISIYKNEILPIITKSLNEKENDSIYGKIVIEVRKNVEYLIESNIDELLQKYNEIQSIFPLQLKKLGITNKITKEQKACNDFFEGIFDYRKNIEKNTRLAYKISEMLNVQVCPYCNRMYTTTVSSKNGRVRPQFDHFFAKSIYPILSLSIYNLVPSCSICNTRKGKKEFSIQENMYPYKMGVNKTKYFSYKLISIGNYEIYTLKGKNINMDNNNKIFLIEDIYKKAHSKLVGNLIEKKKYIEGYVKEINQLKGIDKITNEELKYFLGYSNENEISNISLGKLKNDILDEIM